MLTIPIDSTDAREQRELADELETIAKREDAEHAARCRGGWLGEDDEGRPIVCLRCRPAFATISCPTCSTPPGACTSQKARGRGRCCPDCRHTRRTTAGARSA